MSDLDQRLMTRVKTLRDAQEIAVPTQPLDTTTTIHFELITERIADANPTDANTVLLRNLP
jgi:hypothetical protein